jgi:hypothetical protein
MFAFPNSPAFAGLFSLPVGKENPYRVAVWVGDGDKGDGIFRFIISFF